MTAHLDRRSFFGAACCAGVAAGAAYLAPGSGRAQTAAPHAHTDMTPDEALAMLKEGNANFAQEGPVNAASGRERRLEIAKGQTPFVVLVGCSDSRVSPEILFGRGLGELFIVRNAGNTADTAAMGSIEYAVSQLGVPLVLVLGHERCGAVGAALAVVNDNATFPGSIGHMVEPILPAAIRAKASMGDGANPDEVFTAAVRENVSGIVKELRASAPILSGLVEAGKVRVVGAYYDLEDGKVDFFMEA